jgi:hypothetical protein
MDGDELTPAFVVAGGLEEVLVLAVDLDDLLELEAVKEPRQLQPLVHGVPRFSVRDGEASLVVPNSQGCRRKTA